MYGNTLSITVNVDIFTQLNFCTSSAGRWLNFRAHTNYFYLFSYDNMFRSPCAKYAKYVLCGNFYVYSTYHVTSGLDISVDEFTIELQ